MKKMPHAEALERDLRDLAAAISYPETVDVSYRVRSAITTPAGRRGGLGARAFRLAIVSLGVFLIAFSALLVAAPGAREAIADFLGISGIEIRVTESPSPAPRDEGSLDLGVPTTFAEARQAVDYHLLVPPDDTLGPPDQVYVDDVPVPGTVTFAYEPTDALPETVQEVGALFTQFRARLQEPLLKKIVTPGTTIEPVNLGEEGYWIAGLPHEIFYRVKGEIVADRTRLASNTLLWESNGVSYRFESSLSKKGALAAVAGLD
ncbi:MAG: hypothetical protein M3285_04230 [Actinomycetota bacterium]|nr:hypothetical protein [Actinomycetota bacterium]